MTLSYDEARCSGTNAELCQKCARRDPGRDEYQSHVGPEYDMLNNFCMNWIPKGNNEKYSNGSTLKTTAQKNMVAMENAMVVGAVML